MTCHTIIMKPPTIIVLKKGLKKLQDQTHNRKAMLQAALQAGRPISEPDEEWLGTVGNLVDEECLVEELTKAVDYEHTLKELGQQGQSIVKKLTELAEPHTVAPSKKYKRMIWFETEVTMPVLSLSPLQVPDRQ